MDWDPWRFLLLVACFRRPESEITKRAGLSRQMAWKLKSNIKKAPDAATLKKLAAYWKVSRDWLEDGTGPSGLPLPPGLRDIIESGPELSRKAPILYLITVGGGEMLQRGASWSRERWSEEIDRINVLSDNVKRRRVATN